MATIIIRSCSFPFLDLSLLYSHTHTFMQRISHKPLQIHNADTNLDGNMTDIFHSVNPNTQQGSRLNTGLNVHGFKGKCVTIAWGLIKIHNKSNRHFLVSLTQHIHHLCSSAIHRSICQKPLKGLYLSCKGMDAKSNELWNLLSTHLVLLVLAKGCGVMSTSQMEQL